MKSDCPEWHTNTLFVASFHAQEMTVTIVSYQGPVVVGFSVSEQVVTEGGTANFFRGEGVCLWFVVVWTGCVVYRKSLFLFSPTYT